jgi:hypothetical protein
LLEAWAGQKSFKRKDQPQEPPDDPGNPIVNFHGERRSNQTHQSTTDPDRRLFKKAKGHEAKLAYLGEVLMENRHGLVVDACVVPATGTGERDAATSRIAGLPHRRVTIGGDKGYDTRGFVETLRTLEATPHIAQKKNSRTLDLAVVVFSSLAAGIGAKGMTGGSATLTFFASASVIALLTWAAWALVTFEIGSHLLSMPDTRVDPGELLRTLGFAATPGLIQVFGVLPGSRVPIRALLSLRKTFSRQIPMALNALQCDGDVCLGGLFQIALRRCPVEVLNRTDECGTVPRVLRVFQHHPPGIVGEALEFATVGVQADPVARHDRFENLLRVPEFLAHHAIQPRTLARTSRDSKEGREGDNDMPLRIHIGARIRLHS